MMYIFHQATRNARYLSITFSAGWELNWVCRLRLKFKKLEYWQPREKFYRTQGELVAARTHGDLSEEEGEVVDPVVSWRSFLLGVMFGC